MFEPEELPVSVVIPVYNGAKHLRDTLASVLTQTLPPCEILTVDDGSTDPSAEVIRQIAEMSAIPIHYCYQANQGPGAARNTGVEMASGRLIAFLDQDDLWLPEKLARQVSELRHSQDAGYSITQYQLLLDPGMGSPPWIRSARYQGSQAGFIPSCLVVRTDTLACIGLFDPALRIGNDTDWFVRANDLSIAIASVPEVLVLHRVHPGNQLRDIETSNNDVLQAVHKALIRKRSLM
jgi:glycosyltransferase involved in cell wall biosynthesis